VLVSQECDWKLRRGQSYRKTAVRILAQEEGAELIHVELGEGGESFLRISLGQERWLSG